MKTYLALIAAVVSLVLAGCGSSNTGGGTSGSGTAPSFTLAWSEYPSWSVFGVAEEVGLIDGAAGKQGELEKKWNVDIILKGVDYDTCIQLYGSNAADAVCITNMDILGPAMDRASVAILPTSTSVGADACITVGIDSLEELKGKTTRGWNGASRSMPLRGFLSSENGSQDFPFANMDPGAALRRCKRRQSIQSIMVWNPFVMETLRVSRKPSVAGL